jgi:hypothetical protein
MEKRDWVHRVARVHGVRVRAEWKESPPDDAGAYRREGRIRGRGNRATNSATGTVKKEQPGVDVGLSGVKVTSGETKVKHFLKKYLYSDKMYSGKFAGKVSRKTVLIPPLFFLLPCILYGNRSFARNLRGSPCNSVSPW